MALITKEGASSSITHKWIYDVFLNFTGKDPRKNFVDHLYAALDRKGIITCSDHELERGKTKWEAIEESRISVVILSKHYADSLWCLFELAKIVQCQKEKGQTILPVFFDVDPSEVRNQTGSFGEAFEHLVKFLEENMEEVQRWRAALAEVANLPGWALQDM